MFLAHLWIPIVVSAVLVFIASSVIHMVVKWHRSDFRALPNEDAVRSAIRAGNAVPGEYMIPYCSDMKDMKSPDMQRKFTEGPIAGIVLRAPGPPSMGQPLVLWFIFNLVVAAIAAYVAAKGLPATAAAGPVCAVAGTVAFVAYAGGSVQMGIWWGKPWPNVARDVIDGLIYGVITGAVFAWLWR